MSDDFLYPFLSRPKVRVKNTSGLAVPSGACMRITGASIVGNNVLVNIAQPDSTLHRRYLVNCGMTIDSDSNAEGWGTNLGIDGLVLYDDATGTPAIDEEWGPQNGSWLLKKDYPGFLITGGSQNIGSHVATVATLFTQISFIGKASGSIAKDATSGTVKIFTKNFGNDTGLTVANCANYTSALVDGDKITGSWLSGGPVIAKLVC